MLWTITLILFVLWVLGMVSGSTMGLWVHLLLLFALVSLILAVARRGRPAL
ncbi:MAG: lmo0937 family membrane protein [Myxococcaceae bacterium]